jgi:amino acid transporter
MNVSRRARRLGCIGLASVLFFTVSGGPYGLEALVAALNPGWAVVLIVATPIFWGLPVALMVAELSSTLPDEGGYYVWVKRALGPFWGVQEGWWSICSIAVDMALYPVLFVDYLAYFFPALSLDGNGHASGGVLLARWLIAVAVIATALWNNWRGARPVGDGATVSFACVVAPFALLVVWALVRPGGPAAAWSAITNGLGARPAESTLALGLSTVLWNYSGWDNAATFADEVENPQRNYPKALALTLPVITAMYLLPVLAGVAVAPDPGVWSESAGWPAVAHAIGGQFLGVLVASAALVSAWSLFSSQLLSVSRLPYVLARDGWLPSRLGRVSPRTNMPSTALAACCAMTAVLAVFTFETLIVIDMLLYTAALVLEFWALIALRRNEPDLARPFRIPGGWPVLTLLAIAPALCATAITVAALSDAASSPGQLGAATAAVVSGILLYYWRRKTASPEK